MQETQETWVQCLGWDDPLKKEMATHSSILPRKSCGQRSLADYNPGVTKSRTQLSTQAPSLGPSLQIILWGEDLQSHPLNLMVPSPLSPQSPVNSWNPCPHFLLAREMFLCLRLSCSTLLDPELSAGEDQCLIPPKLFSVVQWIPQPDPARSYSS